MLLTADVRDSAAESLKLVPAAMMVRRIAVSVHIGHQQSFDHMENTMTLRNLEVTSDDPVSRWGFEGVLTALERDNLPGWHRVILA